MGLAGRADYIADEGVQSRSLSGQFLDGKRRAAHDIGNGSHTVRVGGGEEYFKTFVICALFADFGKWLVRLLGSNCKAILENSVERNYLTYQVIAINHIENKTRTTISF